MARKRLPASYYIDGIKKGDRLVLSQAITLAESTRPSDRELASTIIEELMPLTGKAFRIGITGVPGVGKSTFIDAFGSFLTGQGNSVAVLAIDPSSQRSQGSILGDKTRMDQLAHDPKAYIRPSPTGGSLGGVAQKTRESLLLCEAAGYEVIIVETVGVGQSEVTVHGMVDFFLLLMLPNAGDELQGIKKGIMEMADGLVINKSDGEYEAAARRAMVHYSQALRLFPIGGSGLRPKVISCSALKGKNLNAVWENLQNYRDRTQENGYWQERRQSQAVEWLEETLTHQLKELFFKNPIVKEKLGTFRQMAASGMHSPIHLGEQLVKEWHPDSSENSAKIAKDS